MEGVIFSNERMKSLELAEDKGTALLHAGPGATLQDIRDFCRARGYFFPVNPTEESATIGAAASNNSSGSWTYRYGSVRENTWQIEFVTKNGIVIHADKRTPLFSEDSINLRELSSEPLVRPMYAMPSVKNAAGYYTKKDMPLIDLILGSEGTLGFISNIVLKVIPLPAKVIECVFFFREEKQAVHFVDRTRELSRTQDVLSPRALEFFNADALSFLREHHPNIPLEAKAAIIYEQELHELALEDEILEKAMALSEECQALTDEIWMADSPKRLEELRLFRHSLPSIINERFKRGEFFKLSTDSSVPDNALGDILDYYNQEIARSGLMSVVFGHIGNNHFHVNLLPRKNELQKAQDLYLSFMKKAVSLGGTISAEHGIGKLKKQYLPLLYQQEGIDEMRRVKSFFDPKNLFNRGNMFDL
jgi:D-lactate dehydrogenase (cytochrome)